MLGRGELRTGDRGRGSARVSGGFGLGLAAVDKLAQQAAGRVSVFTGHTLVVYAEFASPITVAQANEALIDAPASPSSTYLRRWRLPERMTHWLGLSARTRQQRFGFPGFWVGLAFLAPRFCEGRQLQVLRGEIRKYTPKYMNAF